MAAYATPAHFAGHKPNLADLMTEMLNRASAWRIARRRVRQVHDELAAYTPRELGELGLREADIDFVAEAAARR